MTMDERPTRAQFRALIGRVRRNGAFPDDPLLAVYDALQAALAAVEQERDTAVAVAKGLTEPLPLSEPEIVAMSETASVVVRLQARVAELERKNLNLFVTLATLRNALLSLEREARQMREASYDW